MNKRKILTILMISSAILCLFGCKTQTEEKEEDVVANANLQLIEEKVSIVEETFPEEDMNYDADIPEDFEFAANDENYKEPVGAFCRNLDELEYLKEPMLFRNDLDAYLIYYLPYIDHEYDAYVLKGTEKNSNALYSFKINVEKIMEDGSDLEIRCILSGGSDHYNFFSDLSPDGTEEINWGAGLIDKSDFE